MTTDPIADFLTRIRNAQMARRNSVSIPFSKMKSAIAEVMKKNDFLTQVSVQGEGIAKELVLELPNNKLTLTRVSKPGQRIYTGAADIRKVLNGFGISVISTSQGVMTGYEARTKNLGGEHLCDIY